MKASELIAKLQALVAERGDAEVMLPDSGCGCCAGGIHEDVNTVEFIPEHVDRYRSRIAPVPAEIYIS